MVGKKIIQRNSSYSHVGEILMCEMLEVEERLEIWGVSTKVSKNIFFFRVLLLLRKQPESCAELPPGLPVGCLVGCDFSVMVTAVSPPGRI